MKEEILEKLNTLKTEADSDELFTKVNELREELAHLAEHSRNEMMTEIAEEATEEAPFKTENHTDEKLHDIFHSFEIRKKKFRAAKVARSKDILKEKDAIIDELIKLISDEERIGKAFARFKELQQKWTDLGVVPGKEYKNLQSIYHRHVHNFFYNMKLSRDLKTLDLKRNAEIREQIINQINKLAESRSVNVWERGIRKYRNEWDAAGPVDHERFAAIKANYYEAIGKVYRLTRDFYSKRREQEQTSLEQKKILIEKIKTLSAQSHEKPSEWRTATEEVQKAMEEWKKAGYAPKNVNEEIWHEFRSGMNEFFKNKKNFFGNLKQSQKAMLEKKEELCKKAEELQTPSDWQAAQKQILDLQKEWKQIGFIDPRADQKLWKRFRAACNKFFDAKNEKLKEEQAELYKNLELKEALITRINDFSPAGNTADDMKALKDFSTEWGSLGHVPFKDKNAVYEKYSKALDKQYDHLRMDQKEKHMLKLKNKIDNLAQSDEGKDQLAKEKNHLRDQCKRLEATITQYENNLGFFSKSKNGNPLMVEAETNLQKAKDELNFLKQKLSAFSQS